MITHMIILTCGYCGCFVKLLHTSVHMRTADFDGFNATEHEHMVWSADYVFKVEKHKNSVTKFWGIFHKMVLLWWNLADIFDFSV